MTHKIIDPGAHSNKVAGLMLVSVICFSLVPLFIALGNGAESPFFFSTAWRIGGAIGYASFLLIFFRSLIMNKNVWEIVARSVHTRSMLFWMISYLDLSFYAWSVQYIDVSVAAILYEISTIILVLVIWRLFRAEGRYLKINALTLFLLGIAFLGVAAVITSQVGGISNFSIGSLSALGLGVLLVLVGAAITSMAAYGFRWGADLAKELSEAEVRDCKFSRGELELFGVVLGSVLCNLVAIGMASSIGIALSEPIFSHTIIFGVLGSVVAGALANIVWRRANLMTHNLSVNVISYLRPVFALGWLFAFSLVGEINVGYLMFGTIAIVIANVGIYRFELNSPRPHQISVSDAIDIQRLIGSGESNRVEFKATLRRNLHTKQNDKRIEGSALKTLAAFLNSEGGTLIIGVGDDGKPTDINGKQVGIEADGFTSEDRLGLHLRNIVNRDMGAPAMAQITLGFCDYQGVRIMTVHCDRSELPVYVKDGRFDRFYIRTGPSTTELSIREAVSYIAARN